MGGDGVYEQWVKHEQRKKEKDAKVAKLLSFYERRRERERQDVGNFFKKVHSDVNFCSIATLSKETQQQQQTNTGNELDSDVYESTLLEEAHIQIKNPKYMGMQKDDILNPKIRAKMISLIFEDAARTEVSCESIGLAVFNLDRCFCKIVVKSELELHKLRFASLFLAAKSMECFIDTLYQFYFFSNVALIKDIDETKLVEAEKRIFKCLRAEIIVPVASSFINYYMQGAVSNHSIEVDFILVQNICEFVIYLTLFECKFLKYRQSLLAASIFYYSLLLAGANTKTTLTDVVTDITKYKIDDLKGCIRQVLDIHKKAEFILNEYPSVFGYLKQSNKQGVAGVNLSTTYCNSDQL